MTQEQLKKAIDLQQEMEAVKKALEHLNAASGLYGITIQANNRSDKAFVHKSKYLKDIVPFLQGYFESRKKELEKEFEQL